MLICSDGHEEVVSDGRNCTVCMIIDHYKEKINLLEDALQTLDETADGYKERIESLESDLEESQHGPSQLPVH